ncbi:KOW domain-containing RNA-binding protein [Alteribacillus sp. YIM 98480]|uniref:KOW domain-containing RNA-binding protein n=1 Tax=Alteribacillus sp. YIM 98480 TaxID=2606599 RepID=UPI00131E5474|nr:KOW domain-containing RNA-binding protein [Alteribacillus sp. YIM 98480]
MKEAESPPEVGQVVRIKQGREAGNFAVVIGVLNERFLLLADGEKRKFDRAKKKNINHVEIYPHLSNEVKRSIEETGRVTNAKLRFALLYFLKEQPELLKEGE